MSLHTRGRTCRLAMLAVSLTLAAAPPLRAQEVIDRMMAVVAGDLILQSDVTAAVEFGLVPPAPSDDVTRTVLAQLVDRSLMLAEVEPVERTEGGVENDAADARHIPHLGTDAPRGKGRAPADWGE